MKRRVVKHGPATYIISLPSKWVKEHGVEKGDELEVLENEGSLLITQEKGAAPKELHVDITGLDRTSIMYVIRSFYRLGYDVINVTFEKPTTPYQREKREVNVLKVIHTEVNRLVGYEIVQEREKSCTIKDLQEPSIKDFDQILRRIFLLLRDTSQDFLDGVKGQNRNLLETIEDKHDTITKFVSFCLRLLNKKRHPSKEKTSYYYHIIATLDRVTDNIKYAARSSLKYGKRPNANVLKILEIVNNDINAYYELFYKYENAKVIEINNNRYVAEQELKNLPDKVLSIEVVIATGAFYILEMLLDLIEARTALEY